MKSPAGAAAVLDFHPAEAEKSVVLTENTEQSAQTRHPDALGRSRWRRKIIGSLAALVVFASLAVIGLIYVELELSSFRFPPFDKARASYRRSDAVLLDRHHEVIHELRIDRKTRRLEWVPIGEISPALKSEILFAEDRRFFEHHGVDWKSLLNAAWSRTRLRHERGASTITMQVASKLDRQLQPQSAHRSWWQKWRQIQAAREIEKRWTKDQIFETYLNLVTFRGELQGISAASKGLFNKHPHGLDSGEAAILAALVRAPNAPIDQVARRACQLSEAMNLHLDCSALTARTNEVLSIPYSVQPEAALAPNVTQQLLGSAHAPSANAVTQVVSTLDGNLQRFAIETLQYHLLTVRGQNVHDGAVLVVDNATGEVLAYVGNVGDQASARFVDGIQGRRQAGSILKPFLYGLAIDERLMTAASLIDDAPLDIPAVNGIYRPENYDNRFHGLVTARTALASSLNVPAVKTLMLVGVEAFVKQLHRLGFRNLESPDFYGPSLALGSADITLWDLVNAYRSLANGGVWSPLRLTFDETSADKPQRVFSPGAAFIIADILSDRGSRSETFDLESSLATRFWTAVKTGTSKDMRDNWTVGYSSRYTVGVWAGNFSGQPMWNVSGITGAAPVWVEIMNWLHQDQPSVVPKPPLGVKAENIHLAQSDQDRREWFLQGTENPVVQVAATSTNFRIVYPAAGTIIALDPDIPLDDQKVFFESHPASAQLRWQLDGKDLGAAASLFMWSPTQGKHTLALVDESRQVIDSVNFEVRGNVAAQLLGQEK